MRVATSVLVVLLCASGIQAKERPSATVDVFAIGTLDKITDDYIVVNCLSGSAMTIKITKKTKVIVDGLTSEAKDLKRGMKVRVYGDSIDKTAYTINCYVKDPLPRGK